MFTRESGALPAIKSNRRFLRAAEMPVLEKEFLWKHEGGKNDKCKPDFKAMMHQRKPFRDRIMRIESKVYLGRLGKFPCLAGKYDALVTYYNADGGFALAKSGD
jgi:hypothetical protein